MQQLCNKRILLGITGGIAAYKAAELVRILKKAGAEVRVVMTAGAMEFITPLTLQALSGNPVHHALLDPEAEAGMGHIELAKWADLLLVAPASANFIARLTQGSGDDLLTTICLATEAPIALAPAMNQAMWREPITQANIARLTDLKGSKLHMFGPAEGVQACGDVGPGRMLEPEQIAAHAADLFETGLLAGLEVVITAGPTREAIDPVRYISNHSSGKMGYAIAAAARDAGARVTLISGPVVIPAPERVNCVRTESARDMLDASLAMLGRCNIFIAAAAVADYRPMTAAHQKIKKSADSMELTLVKNPDVVATVAAHELRPFTVGFAAETQDVDVYARDKLVRKNLDMIVANDVSLSEIGFNSDQNAVTVFWAENQQSFAQMSKQALARELVELIAHRYQQTQTQKIS
ncbi:MULTISPECIES: bifunctional phosphopantothenoylcysteine decarboxylase/phosphopantothenate--cysteine ligase CoaBC [unclassified Thalassolituus]|jgi:phosphopantothenoylcysteine decarboxylase/phosphopantothenate--cysteine ligase|uniref:bifunctional phosphopantothenoylcysteine decarboxylase/phosphopantothenate--cysteine ligase CoaBC n=1 Tax=unclassified Thalassolituus TaxID=2624967 RepID=UPI000C36287B|nr:MULTISPECIES: bifunctional phosphopantothenoylcysteine decarboxylase/phosphopantothenate--cysteine ligase CoaBC [unclassified Thalassolituus]MAY15220.1 bifunctional phosphopantothenoylcysteine decarboxylase/phosphopantothenate--cysteine ligase CoaBC [Oceanospirillaceae bacterium]MCA6058879.1 bifunctional phosphopantothenoylcysteine decarboxylase/phosphopantothenate--cysteine ligase CoaBC [Thalassolituus sp. ST750PaO-4]PIQ40902.1 MAG: bifunctional phosphopantothenoylcysteine decarboxylase/phos